MHKKYTKMKDEEKDRSKGVSANTWRLKWVQLALRVIWWFSKVFQIKAQPAL